MSGWFLWKRWPSCSAFRHIFGQRKEGSYSLDVDFEARQVIGARAEVIAKNKRYSLVSADPSVLWPLHPTGPPMFSQVLPRHKGTHFSSKWPENRIFLTFYICQNCLHREVIRGHTHKIPHCGIYPTRANSPWFLVPGDGRATRG